MAADDPENMITMMRQVEDARNGLRPIQISTRVIRVDDPVLTYDPRVVTSKIIGMNLRLNLVSI